MTCKECEVGALDCVCGEGTVCLNTYDKILLAYKTYSDKFGILQLRKNPSPQDSENGPTFTGLFWSVWSKVSSMPSIENPFEHLITDGKYRTTPNSPNPRFSHDNMTGVVCASEVFGWPWLYYYSDQFIHPRDLIFYNWSKSQSFLSWLLLPIVSITMIISCAQTYKTRNGRKIVKTDGKLLTLMRCLSHDMNLTLKVCTWLMSRNEKFQCWEKVANRYFQDSEHPNVQIIREWESANRM